FVISQEGNLRIFVRQGDKVRLSDNAATAERLSRTGATYSAGTVISNVTSFVFALPTQRETSPCLGSLLLYSIARRYFPSFSVVKDQAPATPQPSGPARRRADRSLVQPSRGRNSHVQVAPGASCAGGVGRGRPLRPLSIPTSLPSAVYSRGRITS